MNNIDNKTLNSANKEAIYNVYSYLAGKVDPENEDTLGEIVTALEKEVDAGWSAEEIKQLAVLKNAVMNDDSLKNSVIGNQSPKSLEGLNACTFTDPEGNVSVVFKGTAGGEWIDNGEGLSGVPEQNEYGTYNEKWELESSTVIENDYATDQQVQALNWFNTIAEKNGWTEETNITISGHSKGGNKAQFITMNTDLVDNCYSFDGQGFSPEAIDALKAKYGDKFEERRQKILSFAAYNDYVNVLGERLVPEDHIYYFESPIGDSNPVGYHFMEAMLDENGKFNKQCEQGEISQYIENVSKDLMKLPSEIRQYSTLGIMNILQQTMGSGTPVNGDHVSALDTIVGLVVSVPIIGLELLGTKDGDEAVQEAIKVYWDEIVAMYDGIGDKYGVLVEGAAIVGTIAVLSVATIYYGAEAAYIKYKAWALNTIITSAEKLLEVSVEIYNQVSEFINTVVSGLSEWVNKNYNAGYKYASNNPYIEVNTATLRVYAERLTKINTRLTSLDKRLDSLYWRIGLQDIWNLLQADLMTGYSWRVANCAKYLNETASDFESTERDIRSLF